VDDPVTGRTLRRETDTMPGSAGSSWYFLRYCDPHNDQRLLRARGKSDYWMPVDLYVGGAEHRVGHLLYARMWQKASCTTRARARRGALREAAPPGHGARRDLLHRPGETGVQPSCIPDVVVAKDDDKTAIRCGGDEPRGRGGALREDVEAQGQRGQPRRRDREYGADALRVYLCFLTPLESDKPWQTSQLEAQHNWLKRVWRLFFEGDDDARGRRTSPTEDELRKVHKARRQGHRDIEALSLNTAI
jgi:leucyl-tRNA synthetase